MAAGTVGRWEVSVKRAWMIAVALAVVALAAQPTNTAAAADKNAISTRMLVGEVLDKGDAPIASAIVYLKNTKTLTVKTFITDKAGQYRFPGLSPNTDYEVYAEYKGKKSDTKTLSSFDSRTQPRINLRLDIATK